MLNFQGIENLLLFLAFHPKKIIPVSKLKLYDNSLTPLDLLSYISFSFSIFLKYNLYRQILVFFILGNIYAYVIYLFNILN